MMELVDIRKSFSGEHVLNGVSFSLAPETTLSILGKSGCGKSTLLKIIAGLENPDAGTLFLNGRDLQNMPPQARNIVYLSQEPLLFPHLTVADNLGFGLKVRGEAKAAIEEKVARIAKKLGVEAHLHKKPHQLSGGQKQRVSFGRALIINPQVLLLDEPFGSLDAHTRAEMQALFCQVRTEFKITALFVTHDLKEALQMGDQIASMEKGTLQIFPDIASFVQQPLSGAHTEWQFWQQFFQE